MKTMFKRALAPLMAAGLMMTAGVALAAEIGSHSFKIAVVQVKEHPFSMGAQKFADIVAEKSGGKITAKLFGGGTLGGDLAVV